VAGDVVGVGGGRDLTWLMREVIIWRGDGRGVDSWVVMAVVMCCSRVLCQQLEAARLASREPPVGCNRSHLSELGLPVLYPTTLPQSTHS